MASRKQIESLLQDKERANKFLAAGLVVASDSTLAKCTPESISQALVGVAMSDLNIDRNVGHCYLVPYGFGENKTAQLQIGYKGFIQLLFRAGWLVKCLPVYYCDQFTQSFDGWDNHVNFVQNIDERDEGNKDWVFDNLRGVYVVARHADTKDEISTFVSKAIVEKLRLNSPNQRANNYTKPEDKKQLDAGKPIGIWRDWYVEMAQAKAVKKLAKLLPIGDKRVSSAISVDDESETGAIVDYAKTAETGVVINVKPNLTEEIVNMEREINSVVPDELQDKINACNTISDLGRLLVNLKEPQKSQAKGLIRARQDQIKQGVK